MSNNWTYKKLGEVATFINGYPFKPDDWRSSGLPIIRIQNLNNQDAACNYYDGEIDSRYIVHNGDVLISWSGTLGVYEWMGGEALLNQHIFKVVFDKDNIDKGFFKYAVTSRIDEMKSKVHGITMQHITKKEFDTTTIPLPPLATQSRIVAELDLLQSVIDKQKAQLKELDNLAQAIFYDMFGDPVENENGWEVRTIEEVCSSIVRGPFGSALKKEFFVEPNDTTYKVYEQKHAIQKNASIGSYYISKERFESLKRFEVKSGDIIMSCSGTIGEFFEIPVDAERGLMNQALLKFTLNQRINKRYFLFTMEFVKDSFDKKGTGLQNIGSVGTVKSTQISLPPLSIQQSFAAKIESIEKQKTAIGKSIEETQKLFDYTMDKYFG